MGPGCARALAPGWHGPDTGSDTPGTFLALPWHGPDAALTLLRHGPDRAGQDRIAAGGDLTPAIGPVPPPPPDGGGGTEPLPPSRRRSPARRDVFDGIRWRRRPYRSKY
ncbi:hypothetical protein PSA01_42010 [Pseudonocardia saturnea]|uniref:Uncharacterized protein n=1 Tax=Pseudonocardia saturnea TaxID=33909 RepID=A0ABQ0S2N1_9PSEU|nr:hypothetical protein Pdca_09470 [Pseudonocardia autotrophica]GEC27172.1 hypothetical protein PSA01_42010 [Pseudonocardia saturnea]